MVTTVNNTAMVIKKYPGNSKVWRRLYSLPVSNANLIITSVTSAFRNDGLKFESTEATV
jgi:hypothetical protein